MHISVKMESTERERVKNDRINSKCTNYVANTRGDNYTLFTYSVAELP